MPATALESISPHLRMHQPRFRNLAAALLLCLIAAGCSRSGNQAPSDPAAEARQHAAQQAQAAAKKREMQRQEIEQIPPPTKSRYISVHTADAWSNPFLIVRENTVTVRVIFPDTHANSALSGEMLRPAGARKHDLEVRFSDLAEALASLPPETWPYGRVVAVQEESSAVRKDRHQIRRNVETTIQVLNDLGIVVNEWTGSANGLVR